MRDHRPYSVPHTLREEFVALDRFAKKLKSYGWTITDHPPIYSDPQVIRQQWLRSPNGTEYTDRAFYHFFAEASFRSVLRLLLASDVVPSASFSDVCPKKETLTTYLTFLHDQDLLLRSKKGSIKGPGLADIHDIGHTLEWWTAEWLRRAYSDCGLLPVRHGVTLTELRARGEEGDLDVVALFPHFLVLVECKSSLLQIDASTLNTFFWRAASLQADAALLLVDTPLSENSKQFRAIQSRFSRWQFFPYQENNTQEHYWVRTDPIEATGPGRQTLSWEGGIVCAALVGREQSLVRILEAVFSALLKR